MKKTIILYGLLFITTYVFALTPEWLWADNAGGAENDFGNAISTDVEGNSYITGSFEDTVTFGSYSLTSSGSGFYIYQLKTNSYIKTKKMLLLKWIMCITRVSCSDGR
jgi:hypothetical protein